MKNLFFLSLLFMSVSVFSKDGVPDCPNCDPSGGMTGMSSGGVGSGMPGLPGAVPGGMVMGPNPYGNSGMPGMTGNYNGYMNFRPSNGRPQLGLSMINTNTGLCTFNNDLSPDDRTLLTTANAAIVALRSNEQCAAATQQQFDAFTTSMQSYRAYTDADRPLNFSTTPTANCSNYERFYDLQYEQFVNTWQIPGSSMTDAFANCRGERSQDVAITCATTTISNLRAQMQNQCESAREFISSQERNQILASSLQTGVGALQSIINNDRCVDHDGSQRMGLLQSTIGLVGRAASLSMIGTPIGLGIGALTNLLQSAIGRLFRGHDSFEGLQNQDNFEKVACLYEQIETKSRRCERDAAEQYILRDRASFDAAQVSCGQNQEAIVPNSIVQDLSSLIRELPAQTRTPATGAAAPQTIPATRASFADRFNSIMERMLAPTSAFGGNNETPIGVGLQSARDVVRTLDAVLSTPENLSSYVRQTKGNSSALSTPALNRERARLTQERERAANLLALLTTMNEIANNPNQSPADLERVQTAMSSFNGGNLEGVEASFSGAFNRVLNSRAELTDDLGTRITNWRNNLSVYQMNQATIQRYEEQRARQRSELNDGGVFRSQLEVLRPSLKRLMDNELGRLTRLAEGTSVAGPVRPGGMNERQTIGESILWPMIRACNQLQTVGADTRACEKLSCPDGRGIKTFPRFLSERGRPTCTNPSICASDYSTYICQNKGLGVAAAIRSSLQGEFENQGTVCGRPLNELFRR